MSLLIQCYYYSDPEPILFVSWKDRLLLSLHQFIQEMLILSEKFPSLINPLTRNVGKLKI